MSTQRGARREAGAVPRIRRTGHPTLREEAPSGERWVHEIKFDGYRTQAHLRNGRPAMYTRRGRDWTWRFQPIADALAKLPAADLILDGEAVVADSRGIPDFGLLHANLAASRRGRLLYYAFDLLYLDGFDLRGASLAERQGMLSELLAEASEPILFCRASGGRRRRDQGVRLRHGPRRDRKQAAGRALSLRPGGKLDQGQVRQARRVPDRGLRREARREAAQDRLILCGPPRRGPAARCVHSQRCPLSEAVNKPVPGALDLCKGDPDTLNG